MQKKETAAPQRLLSTSLLATVLAIVGISTYPPAKAADWYSVPPSDCVAPYLDQAFRMRWHESYLMNPSDSQPTWVICPVTINAFTFTGTNYYAFVQGAKMSGASSDTPVCLFGVTDRNNLSQPPYLDVAGQARKYIVALNSNVSGSLWSASPFGTITKTQIDTAIGASTNPYSQAMALWCKLPPGYSLSQLVLYNY